MDTTAKAPFYFWQALKKSFQPDFLLICFVLGAIAGTTGDFVHVYTGVDGYPADGPFPFLPFLPARMPIWVPMLFGSAVILMGTTHRTFQSTFKPRLADNKAAAYIAPLLFIANYAATGFIQAGVGGLQDVWVAAVAILFWFIADGTLTGALLALMVAVVGTAVEMTLVHIGAFYYLPGQFNFLGVPSWLPWLYVSASVAVSLFIRQLK